MFRPKKMDVCVFDSDEEDDILAVCGLIVLFNDKKKKKIWCRDWISNRNKLGAFNCLLQELHNSDPSAAKNFLRMIQASFNKLLKMVRPFITKKDTNMRQSVSAAERLAITLRFLASGNSFTDLMYLFRVPKCTIGNIVMTTCSAIYAVLRKEYLKMPSTESEWVEISKRFEERWNLPNCIGALDGKHVRIMSPGGSMYFNYHGYHSILMLALVDADYRIIYCDVGANGRAGDAALWRESTLQQGIENKTLHIPDGKPLPYRTKIVPYYIVADDAFPLRPYLMKPFPFRYVKETGISDEDGGNERRMRRIFDYRLSRARRISENVFGILCARFGVFMKAMRLHPEKATKIVLACIALHNFLIEEKDNRFTTTSLVDREDESTHQISPGDWRDVTTNNCLHHMKHLTGIRPSMEASEIRNEIKEYVNKEGQVDWQVQMVFGKNST